MNKKLRKLIVPVCAVLVFSSCATPKNITYFNDVNNDLIRTANLSKDIIKIESEIIKFSIPNCNLVNISGKEMSNLINNFLKEIFPLIKKDIDEKIPNKDFYYNNFMIKKQNVTA